MPADDGQSEECHARTHPITSATMLTFHTHVLDVRVLQQQAHANGSRAGGSGVIATCAVQLALCLYTCAADACTLQQQSPHLDDPGARIWWWWFPVDPTRVLVTRFIVAGLQDRISQACTTLPNRFGPHDPVSSWSAVAVDGQIINVRRFAP